MTNQPQRWIKTMTETPMSYCFTLGGGIVPKTRPRVTRNGTYHPKRYRDWKSSAIASLFDQAQAQMLDIPLSNASISIELLGKHPRHGDLDNLAGAILDAMTQSGVIKDDSVAVVTSLAIALHWSKENPTVQISLMPS